MESFIGLCMLLGAGHLLRMRIRLLQRLSLPSCIIGGLLGLAIIQGFRAGGYPLPSSWTAGWSALPGLLINVVFACLFMGVALPKFTTLWRRARIQLAYGQIVAWGQYFVAAGLFLLFIGRVFRLPPMFAGVLPVGFEGGHGTAGGMGPVFADLKWADGKDLALASATFGILSAIIVGMALVNWAARRGYTVRQLDPASIPEDDSIGVIPVDRRPSAGLLTVLSSSVESFSLHIVFVGMAVLIGYLLKQGLMLLQGQVAFLEKHNLLGSFPLFPLCMIGGLIVQLCEDRFDRHNLMDAGLMRRIQNASLDFLVVAAIATIRLEVVLAGLAPLLILVAAGIAWNVFCLVVLARRMLPDAWFERSIAEMGQSMGVTATGLLLLRVVDPDYESPAAEAFACKQLLHEPFMGGGLWTGMAIPLLASFGAAPVFWIATGALAFWFAAILVPRAMRR